jgi:hypothetical protein
VSLALDVLDRLLDLLASDGLVVLDGQPIDVPSAPDVLVVGYATEGAPSATTNRTPAGLVLRDETTVVEVPCLLSCWGGTAEFRYLRDRARDWLTSITDSLHGDLTLSGLVTELALGFDDFVFQTQSEDGAEVIYSFTITATRL